MGTVPFLSVRDLHGVTFSLEKGKTLGLVGVSGAGKSTLARRLSFQQPPSRGEIILDGQPLRAMSPDVQLLFQEPASSLNPRFTAEAILAEPLVIHRRGTPTTRRRQATELMEVVGLPPQALGRTALQFSGGERQRLAIARALALAPKLLILDEPFAGMDLAIQAQISTLLLDLQQRRSLTYILISHDFAAVVRLAHHVAVMENGQIVEYAPLAALLSGPQHPRTRELLDAARALSL